MSDRIRRIGSYKTELLTKSREAMLSAVQIFNNPNIRFKSESFIVLSNIAWLYLLHAYYRNNKIDYRYYDNRGKTKRFHRTKRGAFKYWELERCLTNSLSPIDPVTTSNLIFLIGLRHEIEHKMTTQIDDYLSARFQSCCLNYNHYIKSFFGDNLGIDKHLSISLQFSTINEEQKNVLREFTDLPKNIASYINEFDDRLSEDQYNDVRFSYRVFYVPKNVSKKGQADKVIEFIPANSPAAQGLNREVVVIKEKEKKKHLPGGVVQIMKEKGYRGFKIHHHTDLWKDMNAKDPKKNFGITVEGTWYWYENWLKVVEEECQKYFNRLKS